MKWLEKNWVIVAVVVLGYLYFNGSLGNLLGSGSTSTSGSNGTTFVGG
jgi:hypothetical protein